ncbi:MAG: hypothetical protein H0W97_06725 [Actinobacteria bacterium]|nr:hypothetical protein [Actinomycetota bacterium]
MESKAIESPGSSALAREVGAPMEQAERNRELVERAIGAGFSGRDLSAVAEYLRRSG